jgi:NADPH2:quinone reductase
MPYLQEFATVSADFCKTMKDYVAEAKELAWRANDVLGWIVDKKLALRIDRMYPLADAPQAHCDLEGRRTAGKLVLTTE